MHNNKFQVKLGQIVHVHQTIFVISCKMVYILVFLYVQIQGCVYVVPTYPPTYTYVRTYLQE